MLTESYFEKFARELEAAVSPFCANVNVTDVVWRALTNLEGQYAALELPDNEILRLALDEALQAIAAWDGERNAVTNIAAPGERVPNPVCDAVLTANFAAARRFTRHGSGYNHQSNSEDSVQNAAVSLLLNPGNGDAARDPVRLRARFFATAKNRRRDSHRTQQRALGREVSLDSGLADEEGRPRHSLLNQAVLGVVPEYVLTGLPEPPSDPQAESRAERLAFRFLSHLVNAASGDGQSLAQLRRLRLAAWRVLRFRTLTGEIAFLRQFIFSQERGKARGSSSYLRVQREMQVASPTVRARQKYFSRMRESLRATWLQAAGGIDRASICGG